MSVLNLLEEVEKTLSVYKKSLFNAENEERRNLLKDNIEIYQGMHQYLMSTFDLEPNL
jgi:hypothetical protein